MEDLNQKSQPLNDRDRQSFHDLYQQHRQLVYSICLRMTCDVSESEDLTQEVFINLFRTIGSYRGESAFTTWLHRVTVNHVLMYFRKRKVRPQLTTESEELTARIVAGSSDPKRVKVIDRILLTEVIGQLPKGYREAVILHDVEGLEHSEIARLKGRSVGTSKSQLHKGRTMLRRLITRSNRPRVAAGSRLLTGSKSKGWPRQRALETAH